MFLTREKKILQMLFTNKDTITTAEIAAKLDVSTRTIKSDIKKINSDSEFIENGCHIATKAGVGFWIEYDGTGEQYLKALLYEDESDPVQPELRKYYVACKILQNDGFISMETIASELYVSKSTVVSIINDLAPLFSKYELQLNKKAKYGIKVEGLESQIRKASVQTISKLIGKPSKDTIKRVESFFDDIDLGDMNCLVRSIEGRRGVMFADVSYYELLLQLAVIISREKRGLYCKKEDIRNDDILVAHEFQQATELAEDISRTCNVTINQYDMEYLVNIISSAKTQGMVDDETGINEFQRTKPELYEFALNVLQEIGNKNGIDFFSDDELLSAILLHLYRLDTRNVQKIALDNPFLETIKNNMVYEYEIAVQILNRFSEEKSIEVDENEIGYVALHIGTALEKMITKQLSRKKPVVLVCVSGVGTAQFLGAKLQRLFPNIDVEQVIPLNRLLMYKESLKDKLVLSTVAVDIPEIEIYHISPVLTEEDIKLIQNILNTQSGKSEVHQGKYPILQKLLNKDITILDCDCRSKDEVISFLGTRLTKQGYGDSGYIEAVFARETISDTSIGNMIAIPHAIGSHVLKNGIGLMTLKKPISWGAEKVQIVMMISIDQNTKINLQKAFAEVMELTENRHVVDFILKAKNFRDISLILGGND